MPRSILNRNFKWIDSDHTDIRKTFARERKRLAEAQKAKEQKVTPIAKAKI